MTQRSNKKDSGEIKVWSELNSKNLRVVGETEDGIPLVGISGPEDLATLNNIPVEYILTSYSPSVYPMQTRDPKVGGSKEASVLVLGQTAKASFRPPNPEVKGLENLLSDLRKAGPKIPVLKRTRMNRGDKTSLLVSVFDLHLGLMTEKGSADGEYDLAIASKLFLDSIDRLVEMASSTFNIEQIIFPIGNDFLHVDTVMSTTTKGTPQPESMFIHNLFEYGIKLLIAGIDRLKMLAPVHIVVVPGNHDELSAVHLGYVIDAYYHNDKNVTVDGGPNPYKFYEYGLNLFGFEHGQGNKTSRMAAVMAQEDRKAWSRTRFRTWFLGHQHRSGSVNLEEQGVGVEYIPSLTVANHWHRKNMFNHHTRAAVAYVHSRMRGPRARFQVNVVDNEIR